MRGRDEDHAIDEGLRLEEHRLADDVSRFGLNLDLVEWLVREVVPETRAARDDLKFGQQRGKYP